MVCRRCGSNFNTQEYRQRDGSTKCPSCGAVYRPRPQASTTAQKSQQVHKPQSKKQSAKKLDWKRIATKKIWKLPVWAWIAIILVVVVYPTNKPTETNQSQPEVQHEVIPTPEAITTVQPTATPEVSYTTTGILVADFIERFEKGMSHFGTPCSVIDQGFDNNGYGMLAIDEHLALNYTLANGNISDLFLFASGDGTLDSGAKVMYAIASAMYGLDETTIATETGTIITDMISNGTTHTGMNYVMSGTANDVTGTTVVFSGTVR